MNSNDATVSLSELQERCDEIFSHLAPSGVVVTKEGRPLARITPVGIVNNQPLIGSMKDRIVINGPLWSSDSNWDAQS